MNTLSRPCAGVITQRWGVNPQDYARFGMPGHNGLDIAAPMGTPVMAVADGVVAWAGTDPGYGNYVRLHHPHLGIDTFYAHLSAVHFAAQMGANVRQGQQVGAMGSTGNSTGPHLHLEVRLSPGSSYIDLSGGYGKGRIDPEIAYWLLNHEPFA